MTSTPEQGKPGGKSSLLKQVISTFLRKNGDEISLGDYGAYPSFYHDTWFVLREGEPAETDFMQPTTHEHVQIVVEEIVKMTESGENCQRVALREVLSRNAIFESAFEDKVGSLNRIIDLALRLWLCLHIRERTFAHATKSLQWGDEESLQEFIASKFRQPRSFDALEEKMIDYTLPHNFNVVNLRRYSAIKTKWTSSLDEHLTLDREHRKLKIFRLKYYMYGLRKSNVQIIPNRVIDEYIKTMNLLFPSWDIPTRKFLKKRKETFGLESPLDYSGPLYLSDFRIWRDRLSTLYHEFHSPPPSMTQLFNDRRNVVQWYTFWFAVLIVALTVIFGVLSSVTALLQTRYSYQALLLAKAAAVSPQSCTPCTYP